MYKRIDALRLDHNIFDSNLLKINEILWKTTVLENKALELAKTDSGREKLKLERNTIIKKLKMLEDLKDQMNMETTTYSAFAMALRSVELVCLISSQSI